MAYTRMNLVRSVAIGFMTDTMGRMHSDVQFAGRNSASVTTLWWVVRLTLLLRSTNKFVSLVASKEFARLTAGLFLCNYLRGTECTFPMKTLAIPQIFRVSSAISRQNCTRYLLSAANVRSVSDGTQTGARIHLILAVKSRAGCVS